MASLLGILCERGLNLALYIFCATPVPTRDVVLLELVPKRDPTLRGMISVGGARGINTQFAAIKWRRARGIYSTCKKTLMNRTICWTNRRMNQLQRQCTDSLLPCWIKVAMTLQLYQPLVIPRVVPSHFDGQPMGAQPVGQPNRSRVSSLRNCSTNAP